MSQFNSSVPTCSALIGTLFVFVIIGKTRVILNYIELM